MSAKPKPSGRARTTKMTTDRDRKDSGCYFDDDPQCQRQVSDDAVWSSIVADWARKAHAVVEQEAARMMAITQQRRREMMACAREAGDMAEVEKR